MTERVERQLIAWSRRAELCDAMVLGALERESPSGFGPTEGNEDSQEIPLRLKIDLRSLRCLL
jgi:hypothetical protein